MPWSALALAARGQGAAAPRACTRMASSCRRLTSGPRPGTTGSGASASSASASSPSPFSHVDGERSLPRMVNVSDKLVTKRSAHARSVVELPPSIVELFSAAAAAGASPAELRGPKGPVLSTAVIAGVMGAKQTSALLPFCHPLPLDGVDVDIELRGSKLVIDCTATCTHKTGVEMEALTGASLAALCVYDMCKAVSHDIVIKETRLISKTGGKSDLAFPSRGPTEPK